MNHQSTNLFFHPTTTIFLDDNQQFLDGISLNLGNNLRCQYFKQPEDALRYVDKHVAVEKLNIPSTDYSASPGRNAIFGSGKRLDEKRLQDISILFTDFDMPAMNGIEVCQQIQNPLIKKVLLTEVADEKLAIDALNNEIIDFYIHKNSSNLSDRILSAVGILQQRYFRELFFQSHYDVEQPFMSDSVFCAFFQQVCKDLGTVEHYFIDNPMGYLLINRYGDVSLLLAFTEDEVASHIEVASESNAPTALIDVLEQRRCIPFFYDADHLIYNKSLSDWTSYMYPATKMTGKETYYCSIIRNPVLYKILPEYLKIIKSRKIKKFRIVK